MGSDPRLRALLPRVLTALTLTAASLTVITVQAPPSRGASLTTAWSGSSFGESTAGVVGRSDVVLGQPNFAANESLPLGDGSLGVAAWAAGGFTAQLNRDDTFPDRLSPGQVQIPGLAAMTAASNFTGTLDLYYGVLDESGGGMTLKAWVPEGKPELIVDVTGAPVGTTQSATVNLWSGRTPTASANATTGALAQTWVDNSDTGSSGQTFGAMAAITANAQNVTASVVNPTEVKVSFTPNSDGSYRIIVGAPSWTGGNALTTAASLLSTDTAATESSLLSTQSAWWNAYWANTGLVEMSSADGSAQYLENIRTLYLYEDAASGGGQYPGSQAGVADLFAYDQDHQEWDPAAYWFWNLRAQVAANLSSGSFSLNLPIFNLYLNNLSNIKSWTSAEMGGAAGACVPETMRFNGNGYYAGSAAVSDASCDEASSPNYNALTLTSGAEIALWVWQQYQDTGSLSFLKTYYPLIQQSAIFLLGFQKVGSDGYLHAGANAHETQWAVQDPTTDLAADRALFPATVSAATLLGTDSTLVAELKTAEAEIEPYARTDEATHSQLLTPSSDAAGTDVIGDSFQPTAALRNKENVGLEPVWPYGVIGDDSGTLTALAGRTYTYRPNVDSLDWSLDSIDAARLDMAPQVESRLVAMTEKFQKYISGLSYWEANRENDEPYDEQSATVATTLDEALATDYDGVLRFAPAWPSDWNASGTVYVQDGAKVDVQVESGTLATAAIVASQNATMTVRNPWPSSGAEVVDTSTGAVVVASTTASSFSLSTVAGHSYLVEQPTSLTTSYTYAQVTGTQATAAKHLGSVQIGLDPPARYTSLSASYNNVAISADSNTAAGNFDGSGTSYSETALTNAGAGPGAQLTSSGVTFTMPAVAAGASDDTVAQGQYIHLGGSGSTLGFLVSASWGPVTGTGTLIYTDGSVQNYTLTAPDWWNGTAPAVGAVAATATYLNDPGNKTVSHNVYLYSVPVTLAAGKTLATVVLPNTGPLTAGHAALHVFAMTVSGTSLAGSYNDVGITSDSDTAPGNFDGNGATFSEQALTAASAGPGATIVSGGQTYTMPNVAAGTADNAVSDGQFIDLDQSGSTLGFLVSASYGPVTGTGTIIYTDGSVQSYTITSSDWFSTISPSGGAVAVTSAYQNRLGNTTYAHSANLFTITVALTAGKTIAQVVLPSVGALAYATPALHVFALTISQAADLLAE